MKEVYLRRQKGKDYSCWFVLPTGAPVPMFTFFWFYKMKMKIWIEKQVERMNEFELKRIGIGSREKSGVRIRSKIDNRDVRSTNGTLKRIRCLLFKTFCVT